MLDPKISWRALPLNLANALLPGILIALLGSLARTEMTLVMNLGFTKASLTSMAVGAMRDSSLFWLSLFLLMLARPGSWPFRALGLLAHAMFQASLLCIFASWLSYHTSQSRLNPELLEFLNWDVLKTFLGSWIGLYLVLGMALLALLAWYFHLWLKDWQDPSSQALRPWVRALALGLAADGLFMVWWDVRLFQIEPASAAYNQYKISETVAHAKIPFLAELADSPLVEIPVSLHTMISSSDAQGGSYTFFPNPQAYTPAERRFLERAGLTPAGAPDHSVLAPLKAANQAKAAAARREPVYTRVVLILVESLDRDYLHTYNHQIPPQDSAFMDRMLREYPHLDSFCTSMAPTDFGMYALYHSRLDNDPTLFFHMEFLHENLVSLAAKQGYATWMVGGASWFFQNHIHSYPEFFHFSHLEAMESMRRHFQKDESRLWTWGYPDDIVLQDAIRILEQQQQRRTFMVVKLCNTHNPYYCNAQGPDQAQEDGQARDQVLCAIQSDDQAIASFLADLRQKGLWDEHTLVVLTADHSPAFTLDYENVLDRDFEPLDWVPITFITPNPRPFKRLDPKGVCSQIDLAPTLLPLMGGEAPAYFMGRDLLARRGPGCAVGSFNGRLALRLQDGTRALVKRDPTESEEGDESLAESALRKWAHNYESAAVFGRKAWNKSRPSWGYSGAD
jgi:hypothetical protein